MATNPNLLDPDVVGIYYNNLCRILCDGKLIIGKRNTTGCSLPYENTLQRGTIVTFVKQSLSFETVTSHNTIHCFRTFVPVLDSALSIRNASQVLCFFQSTVSPAGIHESRKFGFVSRYRNF